MYLRQGCQSRMHGAHVSDRARAMRTQRGLNVTATFNTTPADASAAAPVPPTPPTPPVPVPLLSLYAPVGHLLTHELTLKKVVTRTKPVGVPHKRAEDATPDEEHKEHEYHDTARAQ